MSKTHIVWNPTTPNKGYQEWTLHSPDGELFGSLIVRRVTVGE